MTVSFTSPFKMDQLFEAIDADAMVLAGGQSVVALMNLGLLQPERLVSIMRIDELKGVEVAGSYLDIGAIVTHQEAAEDSQIQKHFPCLATMFGQVGNIRVRNAGTLGGNLAQGDPAQDPPVLLNALQASVLVVGPTGERIVSIEELYSGTMTSTLEPKELIARIRVPFLQRRSACSYFKFRPGAQEDYGTVNIASRITLDRYSTCIDVGVAVGSLGVPVSSLVSARDVLIGRRLDDQEVMDQLKRSVRDEVSPRSDRRGSAEYKRHIAGEMAVRSVQHCLQQLTGTDPVGVNQPRPRSDHRRVW